MADLHYVLTAGGDVVGPNLDEIEEWENQHQGEDYGKYYVPEEVADAIAEASEYNPANYSA